MLSNQLNLELRPSSSYLVISALIYGLCVMLVWSRIDTTWISVVLTSVIAISAVTFFPKYVQLSKSNSITSLTLEEGNISIDTKNGEQRLWDNYHVTYQSRQLVIIRFGKTYVPIFQDSLAERSLSALNRFLNVTP